MSNLSLKQKIMVVAAMAGAILIFIFQRGLGTLGNSNPPVTSSPTPTPKIGSPNQEPQVVAAKPENLEGSIILASQVIEITFNLPLENRGEFKYRIDPEVQVEIQLSNDRKTAKIIPLKPYKLGVGFTLFIKPDTKFDGKKQLGRDIIYHFRTINYRGV